jgi:endoglucanase
MSNFASRKTAVCISLLGVCSATLLTACLVPKSSMKSGSGGSISGQEHNLLGNSTFAGGKSVPWSSSFTAPGSGDFAVENEALCLKIEDKGVNNWDAQLRHRDMVIERGRQYTVRFKAWASAPTSARPKVGMSGPPYAEYWADTIQLGSEPRQFEASFLMKGRDDPTAELTFHLGGALASSAPLTVCIDDVLLEDPDFVRPATQGGSDDGRPKLLVNQLGYLPKRAKLAALIDESTSAIAWQLASKSGEVVLEGQTTVHGRDAASGRHVHVIDFSDVSAEADGYVLSAGGERSHPFAIAADVYRKLKYDALAYFYHNRSGIEIALPYAGDKKWTRPAGHLHDKSVGCAPGAGCSHTLDVAGGWYDAGDHGKYVVNGGIALWTLLNQYETLSHLGKSAADFEDGKLQIPEQKNGTADLLDEARWELSFLLKMQIPSGPLAGMVHHKMHDAEWTALPLAPHEDDKKRQLYAPSTAATLNLAATAAQGARIWKSLDAAFAKQCLDAAQRAYAAALKNPQLYAKPGGVGGGPYDDADVSDEFYWAAAELLITTGAPNYLTAVTKSPHHGKPNTKGTAMGGLTAMTWQNTAFLGTMSLATVPSAPKQEQTVARAAVKQTADGYLATLAGQGFRLPFAPAEDGTFPWGSNSSVLNNMMVLGLAHLLTADARYLDAVVAGMDYLLGRNPLDQSYVTGYGERPLEHPHHRFWANQANKKYPGPPPGAVSGGPNSKLEDPYAKGMGLSGCAPQTCFVDHIESFSTNEITINWNAPLAWTAALLDEAGQRGI